MPEVPAPSSFPDRLESVLWASPPLLHFKPPSVRSEETYEDSDSRLSVRRMRSFRRRLGPRLMMKNLIKRRSQSKRLKRVREKRGPRGPRTGGNKQRHRRRQRRGRRRSQRAQRKQRRERRRSQRARRRMQQIKDRARMRAAVGRLDKGGGKGRRSIGNAARGLMA